MVVSCKADSRTDALEPLFDKGIHLYYTKIEEDKKTDKIIQMSHIQEIKDIQHCKREMFTTTSK